MIRLVSHKLTYGFHRYRETVGRIKINQCVLVRLVQMREACKDIFMNNDDLNRERRKSFVTILTDKLNIQVLVHMTLYSRYL